MVTVAVVVVVPVVVLELVVQCGLSCSKDTDSKGHWLA